MNTILKYCEIAIVAILIGIIASFWWDWWRWGLYWGVFLGLIIGICIGLFYPVQWWKRFFKEKTNES